MSKVKISESHANYNRVSKAIAFLSENYRTQPGLEKLSAEMGVSKYHFQRIFSEWAGITPKQFLKYITKEHAKEMLRNSSVMETAYSCGLSGSGRLHDLFISCESVTPGEYKNFGAGLEIAYGIHTSPFGYCFVAVTQRGICKLSFLDETADFKSALLELESEWPLSQMREDASSTETIVQQVFGSKKNNGTNHKLLLKGSPFQLKVWEALLNTPRGRVCSYNQIAALIGKQSAVRAVAGAIARNKIGYLIPCHRVIRSTGVFGDYRWGKVRKAALIVEEAAGV